MEVVHQEIHELRSEVASVRAQMQTMEGVIASLVKLSSSHGVMSQEGTSHGGALQKKDRSPRVRTFEQECSVGSTQGFVSLVDFEGDLDCEPRAARVLFGILGASTAPHHIRTCLRVVLGAVMVLILANLVWSTLEVVTRVAMGEALQAYSGFFLLWASCMVHWVCTLVLRPRCSFRGDKYTIIIILFCVTISSVVGVTSGITLSLVLRHGWPDVPNVMTWVGLVFLKWMLVATHFATALMLQADCGRLTLSLKRVVDGPDAVFSHVRQVKRRWRPFLGLQLAVELLAMVLFLLRALLFLKTRTWSELVVTVGDIFQVFLLILCQVYPLVAYNEAVMDTRHRVEHFAMLQRLRREALEFRILGQVFDKATFQTYLASGCGSIIVVLVKKLAEIYSMPW